MNCVLCRGKTVLKHVEYEELGVAFGKFKATVCQQCGEQFFDERVAEQIQQKSRELGLFGLARKTKVAEIGNSIAVRIPKDIAAFLHLKKGGEVTLMPKDKHGLLVQV